MDRPILKAFYLLLLSIGLALSFNFLFFEKQIGVSVFIISTLLVSTVSLFGIHQKVSLQKTWWIMALIGFFALMPSIRDSEFLTFLNICATFGLLMLFAHELAGTPTFIMKLRDYFRLITVAPFQMLRRGFATLGLMSQFKSEIKHRDVSFRVLKGALIALPILFIFGVLFSEADLAFSKFIKGFFDFNISKDTLQYSVLLSFAFIAALSFLSYIFFPKKTEQAIAHEPHQSETAIQTKEIEVMVFLGLIAALFLVFIGFQVTYLFGGETNIINAGFTYAEYARRGFWELLTVAILSLIVLLTSEKFALNETQKDKRFQIPALILIAEVGIVIISAFKRLSLYIAAYGLTEERFYVAIFIMLLMLLFILLAVKFIKAEPDQFFAFGTFITITTFLFVVNLVNPDAFIAKAHMKRYEQGNKSDLWYVMGLSADAAPWKMELYTKFEGEDKRVLDITIMHQKNRLQKASKDWQSANLSRSRALKLLQEIRK